MKKHSHDPKRPLSDFIKICVIMRTNIVFRVIKRGKNGVQYVQLEFL